MTLRAQAPQWTRRAWLRGAGIGALAATGGCRVGGASAASPRIAFGLCAGVDRAPSLAAIGCDYLEESVQSLLRPDLDDAAFAARAGAIRASAVPVRAANSFLPARLRSVGPEADHDAIAAWSRRAFARAAAGGIATITFGSAGSRQLQADTTRARAEEQFVQLLQRLGPIAAEHRVTVAVEPLCAAESNFLNRIAEVVDVVRRVDHERIRVTADLYHMELGGDGPDDLARAMPFVRHIHLAAPRTRALPGTAHEAYEPWFGVLAQHGYRGCISIEANGGGDPRACADALRYLRAAAQRSGLT